MKKHSRNRSQHRTYGRRSQNARKYLRYCSLKAAAIVLLASSVGLSVIGFERYSAIASEILPKFNLSAETSSEIAATQRVHHFAMSVVGGRSTVPVLAQYQLVEMELSARGVLPRVVLRLQKMGRNQPIQVYERVVSERYFSGAWQQLRDLEIAQLTDLSPYTEQITTNKTISVDLTSTASAAATYRFQFKDGVYDYPNSFEVHAPGQLSDTRYEGIRALAFVVLEQNFGDVLTQP